MKKPFDIYSDHRIPFMVGTWARAHRFNPTAVDLARSLVRLDNMKAQIAKIERDMETEEANLRAVIAKAEERMEALNGI